MNSFSEIALRYTKALFDLASEKSLVSKIEKDFSLLKKLYENDDIQKLINSSNFSVQVQSSTFKKILNNINANSLTINFILVLIENRRISYFREIISSFFNRIGEERGELKVEVITATKIEKNTENEIFKSIKKLTNKKNVTMNKSLDPSIIGGLVIKYGSTMIDSSIKTQLNQLKLKMKDI